LPAGLLSIAKSHLRIDGTYDDHYIERTIARAISQFERSTNVSVNPVTWLWSPDAGNFRGGRAQVPVSPVASFTVSDGADISADYTLTTEATHGVGLFYLNGAFADGMAVSLVSGYSSAGAIEPGIEDIVLRFCGHLYEHREILVPGVEAQTPGWWTDCVATYWVPRC
jgi:uncharacterized phiE125 gp8 family phage protein